MVKFNQKPNTIEVNIMTLQYLFIAEFEDGSTFEQTPQDKSTIDPDRNCYYDVLQSGKNIIKFSLIGKGNTFSVNLKTGLFTINGVEVILESEKLPTLPEKFNLIWYHQVTRDLNVTYELKSGAIQETKELPEFREYFIGWECEIAGIPYKQKLGIA